MKTIDVAAGSTTIDEVLRLAEQHDLVLRSADGKTFAVVEIKGAEAEDDFADEVALIRQNATLRDLLAQRSREPGVYTLDQVRQELDLREGSE